MLGVFAWAVRPAAGGGSMPGPGVPHVGPEISVVHAAGLLHSPKPTLPEDHQGVSSFAKVYQPISTLFVPDLRRVYSGVARVLEPGGLYFADFAVPLLLMAEHKGWDGTGYALRITEPYVRGEIL